PACPARTSQTGHAVRASWRAQKGGTAQHLATSTPVQTARRTTTQNSALAVAGGNSMMWSVWDRLRTTSTCVQLLITICCLMFWPLTAEAQKTAWEQYQREGVQAYKQGHYAEAEQQFTTALQEAERLGLSDQRLIVTLTSLAMLYSAQNQPDKAEPLYRRLLILRENTLEPEHLEVPASLDNLAEIYEAQGQYSRAEPLYQRALTIREKTLKPNHPGIASSLDNLAGIYEVQG